MHVALKAANWNDAARLLNEEWKLRRTNAPGIATPLIDKLIAAARKQGARAANVCGAGGGGCVLALAAEAPRDRAQPPAPPPRPTAPRTVAARAPCFRAAAIN